MNKLHHLSLMPRSLVLVLILALSALSGNTQIYPEQYLQQAIENNPGLQARQKTWEAAQQQKDIAASLPDPTLSAGFFTPPMERFMGSQWFDVGLMQMFPWPGTLSKQKSVAEIMAEREYHQFRENRNRLYMEMTRLWLDIYRKEQELKIIERYRHIIQAREDIIYSRYEGGNQTSGIALDLYRLEIQLETLDNRENRIREEHLSLVERFNILMGKEEREPIEVPDSLPAFTPATIDRIPDSDSFASNPLLNSAQAEADAAAILQQLSRLKTRPMLGVGLQYSYFAPGEASMGQMEGGHMLMPMVSVSLPIFSRKNQAMQDQGRSLSEAAHFRQTDRINALQTQWSTFRANINNLQRDQLFYKRQLEVTTKTLDLVINAYASGYEGFDELLRIQDQLLDIEWRMLENQIDQYLAKADMDMLMARNIFK